MNGTEFKLAVLGNSFVENHLKMFIQECGQRSYNLRVVTVSGMFFVSQSRN